MSRKLTPTSTLENLKREAKRWLSALREKDDKARARLEKLLPDAPVEPRLRDVVAERLVSGDEAGGVRRHDDDRPGAGAEVAR